jgi:Bifunctional DNA primase/polymerase, N-terminal
MSPRRQLAEIADDYWNAGWSPFPLPRRAKKCPPKGVTGRNARPVTEDDLDNWARRWGNIGIVMPDGVVGIDVDAYKPGNIRPSDLPPTTYSANRIDSSGIYFYRVPPGTKLQGVIPGVGETVQWFHRFAVVYPSIHPEGRQYRWYDARGNEAEIPYVEDLPWLPDEWLKRLSEPVRKSTGKSKNKQTGNVFDGDIDEWLDNLPGGPMSHKVRSSLRRSVQSLRRHTKVCRYDVMVKGIGALVQYGAERQRGVGQAIDDLIDEYVAALKDERDRDPYAELDRAITGAIRKWGRK